MYENNRKHYRVAEKEIYENPCDDVYATKQEQNQYFLLAIAFSLVSFLLMLPLLVRHK